MKKLLLVAAALLVGACADPAGHPRTFESNDAILATGNGALMGCSCMFVMEMSETYCRAWVKASPDVAKVAFDTVNKTVESSAFISFSAKARFVDAKRGCVLE
jgi:hypothetical protein